MGHGDCLWLGCSPRPCANKKSVGNPDAADLKIGIGTLDMACFQSKGWPQTSARDPSPALATPAAMVPMPAEATSFTETFASGLTWSKVSDPVDLPQQKTRGARCSVDLKEVKAPAKRERRRGLRFWKLTGVFRRLPYSWGRTLIHHLRSCQF